MSIHVISTELLDVTVGLSQALNRLHMQASNTDNYKTFSSKPNTAPNHFTTMRFRCQVHYDVAGET